MHPEAFALCRLFVEKYLDDQQPLSIADVGSLSVNGDYRSLFQKPLWAYVGFDLVAGANVDSVLPHEYEWGIESKFDVVISGQCVEHVRKPWHWVKSFAAMGKPGALFFLCAPNTWEFHEHPIDCWRIWPDGMRALFDEAGIQEISIYTSDRDTVAIGRKG